MEYVNLGRSGAATAIPELGLAASAAGVVAAVAAIDRLPGLHPPD